MHSIVTSVHIHTHTHTHLAHSGEYESVMLVSNENIQLPLEECTSDQCHVCSNNLVGLSLHACTHELSF